MPWLIVLPVIALPIVEIALFIKSSQMIGIGTTILLAIAAGVIGVALVKRQGVATMMRARQMLDRGEMPVAEVFDGLCLGIAGGLLLLPGFFSDVVALALLLPPVRAILRGWLGGHVRTTIVPGGPPQSPHRPPVIDADYRVVDEDDKDKHN